MNGFFEEDVHEWCDSCDEFTLCHIEYVEDGKYIIYRQRCSHCGEGISAGLLKENWKNWEEIFGYDKEILF